MMKINNFFLSVLFLAGCKGAPTASSALDLETCAVAQSKIITTDPNNNRVLVCSPTATPTAATLSFILDSGGTACVQANEPEGDLIFSHCDRTWTRPTCINVEVANSDVSTFYLDNMVYVNDTRTTMNIRYKSESEDFTYSYQCDSEF